jgi:uncharacterized protein YdbL (DUF1318 family)
MIRRLFLALAIAAGLAGASAALAQSAAAKATVDAAKAQGVVGEQGDGMLGLVSGSADPAVKAAVDEINAGRAKAYQDIAAKTGVAPDAAGQAAAQQLLARLPAGYYYRPLGGAWTRK